MGLFGKVFKAVGTLVGTTMEYGLKATGHIMGDIADLADSPNLASDLREIGSGLGEFTGTVTKNIIGGVGWVVDKSIEITGKVGGEIGEFVAETSRCSDDGCKKGRVIGTVIGSGVVGLATGEIIGTAVAGVTAATGVASTGTAISTLHGAAATNATLASIGGGALSAGGGGMAAGQAVLTGINAGGAVLGGIDGVSNTRNN